MKKVILIFSLIVTGLSGFSQTVGIGVVSFTPINLLDVKGSMAIGNSYAGVSTAPANGLIVEGPVGIGTVNPLYLLDVAGVGRYTGTLTIGAYTLPNTDGTSGQVLTTNGAGVVSWQTPSSGNIDGMMAFPVITTDYISSSTSYQYNQYYGNIPLSNTVYNDFLSGYSGTTVQIKAVGIAHIGNPCSGGGFPTTMDLRIVEYTTGTVFGTWTNSYTFPTDNINIETPWTTIVVPPTHRGYKFEIRNSEGCEFTVYNLTFYMRVQ